ncbi:MAG TPA: cysteine desulfurase NifS [Ruminococcaceae bacterium]|nr:cysteine desulfurase NifS [Oscillospiraceae bacterium]
MMQKFVYADNAATTKISDRVYEAMLPYLKERYGNPSSLYGLGAQAMAAVTRAREQVAAALNSRSDEIYFTSGGTESDNWAIKGMALAMANKGRKHIVSSQFEHHAVLHSLLALEKQGYEITLVNVNRDGIIRLEDLKNALREDTGLVTIMFANNEIGTVQPIAEIGAFCKQRGIVFHTDAVQAVGSIPIDLAAMNIDMLSLSAHKIHGPKGVGALYIRKGVVPKIFIDGGAQERGRRAGTENTAGIVALGVAAEDACKNIETKAARISALRDDLIRGILRIERSRLNGDASHRLPGNASFCFEGIEGESLLLSLEQEGIMASSGSACTSGSLDPSHVLLALGLPHEIAHGSLRLSLSHETTAQNVSYILEKLPPIVKRLRDMSPLWERLIAGERVYPEGFE